ncbi:MAG: hypothetical protein AMQ22_00676 [Candidatus Methanofastidiosum methylothiophilum]|uniref:Uncharacterized protein n=1 Tax=Candidatus Methanofastidiosum methylothiophilum TaxID=1705564 RepID=A0A150J5Y5_9EURY|nr:MAG: hypothetical protein AMQ22_00676 [Candidatus Methanofastidiosum methylthiophilus]
MNADKQLMLDFIDTKEFREYARYRLDHYRKNIDERGVTLERRIKINLEALDYRKYYDIQTNAILRAIIKGFYKITTGNFYEKKITKDTMIFAINNLTF